MIEEEQPLLESIFGQQPVGFIRIWIFMAYTYKSIFCLNKKQQPLQQPLSSHQKQLDMGGPSRSTKAEGSEAPNKLPPSMGLLGDEPQQPFPRCPSPLGQLLSHRVSPALILLEEGGKIKQHKTKPTNQRANPKLTTARVKSHRTKPPRPDAGGTLLPYGRVHQPQPR